MNKNRKELDLCIDIKGRHFCEVLPKNRIYLVLLVSNKVQRSHLRRPVHALLVSSPVDFLDPKASQPKLRNVKFVEASLRNSNELLRNNELIKID